LRTLVYSLQAAFKSLWHEKWINFLTILSIGTSLLILSAFVGVTLNADSVLKRWAKSFGLVVYLDNTLNRKAEDRLKDFFQQDPDVLEVKYISKDRAIRELHEILGTNASILEELEGNPLPSSFELRLRRELLKPEIVKRKAGEIKQINGVEDVQYGEKWLSSLNTLSKAMKIIAAFLGCAIFTAVIFISYNTIKIFFFARRHEIETLKLLGATRSFIKLPFLIEGLFIGIFGGIISCLALFGVQSLIVYKSADILPSIRAIIVSLPVQAYILVPLAGAFMSLIGSFIAVGKIKY
jgi:cell division transport system permease protein